MCGLWLFQWRRHGVSKHQGQEQDNLAFFSSSTISLSLSLLICLFDLLRHLNRAFYSYFDGSFIIGASFARHLILEGEGEVIDEKKGEEKEVPLQGGSPEANGNDGKDKDTMVEGSSSSPPTNTVTTSSSARIGPDSTVISNPHSNSNPSPNFNQNNNQNPSPSYQPLQQRIQPIPVQHQLQSTQSTDEPGLDRAIMGVVIALVFIILRRILNSYYSDE